MRTGTIKKPAPYTRDTLALIRDGASAADLGWDQNFYVSICRKHGLAGVAPAPPHDPALPPAQVQQIRAEALRPKQSVDFGVSDTVRRLLAAPWHHGEKRDLIFAYSEGGGWHERVRRLGRHSANTFILLASAHAAGAQITAATFAEYCGISAGSSLSFISDAVARLRQSLVGTPLHIQCIRGPGGGYRFVAPPGKSVVAVRLIALGEFRFDHEEAVA